MQVRRRALNGHVVQANQLLEWIGLKLDGIQNALERRPSL